MPPKKPDDEAVREERRWKIERERWRFRSALALASGIFTMYFGVAPIAAVGGYHIVLPRIEYVLIFLAVVSAPAFGVTPAALSKSVSPLLSRIKITIAPAPPDQGGVDGNDDA
jgi:hypothetical protein